MFGSFPFYRQLDQMDCGSACVRMVAAFYGQSYGLSYLRELSFVDREGVSLAGIQNAAEQIGFEVYTVKIPLEHENPEEPSLLNAPLPCIIHWYGDHFVVVYKINSKYVWISDPAKGKYKLKRRVFEKAWKGNEKEGLALLLEPSPAFYVRKEKKNAKLQFRYLLSYLKPYRKLIFQLFAGLLIGSLLQLIFPFLTQSVVDIGIQNQDVAFIYLILLAQLMLFLGQMAVNFIQSWVLLHIGTRVNISLLSDFLQKLMKLPLGFFDNKMTGDLLQRIYDHRRIETFLTASILNITFSVLQFVIFGIVLLVYNRMIFFVFLSASLLYVVWVRIFLQKRRVIDEHNFELLTENQNTLIELIQGMQEIKLQTSEQKRRQQWLKIQKQLFQTNRRSLSISQYQDAGAGFLSQLKDIVISFLAAKAVIEGQMTLGMMLAVQYIIGQLNVPLQQLITFIRSAQDARISLERLGEIHTQKEERTSEQKKIPTQIKADISLKNVSFRYNALSDLVLDDIDLHIPYGKTTAVVGSSGSGKTTLIKMLLGFYPPEKGEIHIGDLSLQKIDPSVWRLQCGAVMQDGFIFSDTIQGNITESTTEIDKDRLANAAKVASIDSFIHSLPQAYKTVIGNRGLGISQGQKQRILIARAVYKNPDYIFFDEATNALDTENEKIIIKNLKSFFYGKTKIIVAHRMSTVKDADQIIVLKKGKIAESGKHDELIKRKGVYFQLIKNQLEIGGA